MRRDKTHLRRVGKAFDRTRRALGISRSGLVLLLLLLLLGIYESVKSVSSSFSGSHSGMPLVYPRLRINSKKPFKTLAQAGITLPSTTSQQGMSSKQTPVEAANAKVALASVQAPRTTAILLSWKRLDNLVVVLAHLCAYTGSMFDTVQVWNNNPDVFLTQEVGSYQVHGG